MTPTARGRKGIYQGRKARQEAEGSYLSVGVLMVFLIPGIVILLDEAKVLLPLTLQSQLSPLHVCGEITLRQENPCQGRPSSLTTNQPLKSCQSTAHLEASGTEAQELVKELSWGLVFPAPDAFADLGATQPYGIQFPKTEQAIHFQHQCGLCAQRGCSNYTPRAKKKKKNQPTAYSRLGTFTT